MAIIGGLSKSTMFTMAGGIGAFFLGLVCVVMGLEGTGSVASGMVIFCMGVPLIVLSLLLTEAPSVNKLSALVILSAFTLALGMVSLDGTLSYIIGWIPGVISLLGGITGFANVANIQIGAPTITCPRCGRPISAGMKAIYCPYCGTKLPP